MKKNTKIKMQRGLLVLTSLVLVLICKAQSPGIKWQETIGGSSKEQVLFTVKTIDNAVILIGETLSNDGGFSSGHGSQDVWIEKVSLDGVSQWRKVLGGSYEDVPISYYYNTDGSLIVASNAMSSDGDITDNHGTTTNDIWICKFDTNGNILWQKCFGGGGTEDAGEIIKCIDGNYLLAGSTDSNDGDVTDNHGGRDTWVIKFNETGTLLWQKTLGGSGFEEDYGVIAVESGDGSIYILTNTYSDDGDVSGNHGLVGTPDIWLVKLNPSGTILWQRCLGGTGDEHGADIKLAPSGEIYIFGDTYSPELPSFHGNSDGDLYFCRVSPAGDLLLQKCFGSTGYEESLKIASIDNTGKPVLSGLVTGNDGDVVGFHGLPGKYDIWVYQLDLSGDIEWQRVLGGTEDDQINGGDVYIDPPFYQVESGLGSIIKTDDQGFLITAFTRSDDGDITDFHHSAPVSPSKADIWVVKLSATGQLEYSRCLGGTQFDYPGPPIEIQPNEFIITGKTNSRDGDVQTINGSYDGWVIRLGPVNRIKGTVFVDQNANGIKDVADSLYADVIIKTTKGSDIRTTIPYKGNFLLETDTGTYNTSLTMSLPYYTVTPASHASVFSNYFNTDSFSFALQPIPGIKDLIINVVPLTPARPGFDVKYAIYYKNAGTVAIPAGEIVFKKDARLDLLSAVPAISSSVGDTLKWSYTNLDPLESGTIILNMHLVMPPVVNGVTDTLASLAIITPVAGDITPEDDTSVIRQRVQGSYDPNDKAENVGGSITLQRVQSGEYLNYFIRFQNTGTDTAFNVIVRDTLETDLDLNTFQMIGSSHPYQLNINSDDKPIWNFYGINLPDSNINEPASHGYIAYRIKPKGTLNIGATILNRASIYFDFNPSVETNYAMTIVGEPEVLPLRLISFDARYRQPDALLEWTTADELNVEKFEIERGADPQHFTSVGRVVAHGSNGGTTHYQFNDPLSNTSGEKFYYRLKMMDVDQKFTYSGIQQVKREGKSLNEMIVTPNPVKNSGGFAYINFDKEVTAQFNVIDMQGMSRYIGKQKISKGYNVIPLHLADLKPGTYILQFKAEGKFLVSRFVVIR